MNLGGNMKMYNKMNLQVKRYEFENHKVDLP